MSATQELLASNDRAMSSLSAMAVAEEPASFDDYICDDGKGYGPGIDALRANCEADTNLPALVQPVWPSLREAAE